MSENLGFDIFILVARLAFIFLLYFFLLMVVRIVNRELNTPLRRSRVAAQEPAYSQDSERMTGPVAAAGEPSGRLVVTQIGTATTVRPGVVFQLGPIMPIGRRPNNAIVLDDEFVSSDHALLAWRDGRWWVSDVASKNGTFLNAQAVTQPVPVGWGDLIGIGGVRLRLEP